MLYATKVHDKMMTGRHWLLAAVTALVLFCALGLLMPGTARAATSVSTEDELRTALGRHDTDIVLTADITTTGEMTINNEGVCSIDLNDHTISVSQYAPSRIFNIASNWGTDPKVSISNGTLSGGIAATDGGAIYSKSSYGIQLTKVAFNGNSSGGNGGAVALEFDVSHERNYPDFFKITDCTFTNNSAVKSGGGMYIQYNDKDISDSAIATLTRCTFDGNKATKDGGGLCVYSTQSDRQYQTPITDTRITNNTAGGCGGGLYVGGDTRVTMTGTSSGASVVSGNKTTGSYGGGIYLQGGTHASVFYRTHGGRLTLGNTTVDNNTSTGSPAGAGGIYIDAGSDYKESTSDPYPYSPHLTMTNSSVTNNVSSESAGGAGGIYSLGGVVDITGGSISGNTANDSHASGGGIYSGWSLKMTNVTVTGNKSYGTFSDSDGLGLGGGGICNNSSYSVEGGSNYSMVLTNCTISDNTAVNGNGGGISGNWGTNDASALIKGCSISNNHAQHDGGGIHACWIKANKTLDFSGTNVISGNTAGNNDGGITLTGLMNMNVLDGVTAVKGNTAWFNAGGIFNPGSNFIEIRQGATLSLLNNTTTVGDGGGIFNRGSIGIFDGGTLNVDGNTAGRYGGGVYNGQFKHYKFDIQAEIKASTAGKNSYFNITNNTAGGDGGGIYNFGFIGKDGVGNLITTVTGNTAAGTAKKKNGTAMQGTGGGISNVTNSNDQWTNTGTISIRNDSTLTVMGNQAKGNGGGIADFGDLNLKNSVKITDNTTQTGSAKANNLYLKSGTTISASALSDDSVIGVTMQNVTGQVTNNASSDLASSFTSDDPYYGILNKGSASSQTVWVSDAQVSFQAADGGTPVTTTLYNALEMAHNRHATITLLTDITSSVQYTVTAGSTVELNLNNHTISRKLPAALSSGSIFKVESNANLTLSNGALQGGNSVGSGGGIDNNGTLSLVNVQVKNCQSGHNGGAIYNTGNLTLADNVTIQNCKAVNGGGIYNEGTLQCAATVTKNTASQNGGGLYNAGTGTTNFNNCHFNYNGAAQNGGGVYNAGKLISTQSEIISNSAINGGGIFAASGGNLTVAGYTKVYYNLNGYKNNNLYLASGQTVNIADTVSTKSMYYTIGIKTEVDPMPQLVLTGNNSQDYSLFFISDDGHPIYNTGSGSNQVVCTGYQVEWGNTESYGKSGTLAQAVAFANAEAQRGTTVYIKLDQDVTPASYGLSGIGFYNASVVLDLNGHTIDRGLTALTNNGAVITMSSYNLTVKNGTIKGGFNTYGGGIQALSESLTLDNVTVTGNHAGSYGGGVYALGSKVTLQNGSKITGNTAGKTGGGLYLASPKTLKPTTFSDTTQITGNTNALGAVNNVYLPQWYGLTASGLTTGANIGVITQNQPTAGNPIAITTEASLDNSGYFNSDNTSFEAGNTISGSNQVVKLFARADAPAAPIIANKINDRTDTSITVYGIRGQEYSIDGGTTWQDSSTFTGLTAGTQYSIVTRIKATKSTIASKTSAALVTTTKLVMSGVTVKMDNYTYGDSKSPSVIGLPNGLSVTPTYYYKTQSDTGKGTKWTTDRIAPNAYVIYAEIPATEDYTAYTTATTGFTVTAKQLTIEKTTIVSKVYDGTKTATVTPGTLQGVLDGDTVVLSASAEFPSVNPGDQQVPVTYTISGSSAANYFAPASQSVSGVITPKAASLSLDSGQSAVYTTNQAVYPNPEDQPHIHYTGDGTRGNWGYSTDGGKTWLDGMPVDAGSYLIRLTYNQGTTTAAVTSAAVSFTITKANGTPVNITTTPITYGDTLVNSVIQGRVMVGDNPVTGTWSWTNTSIQPAVADSGTTEYYYTWIPSEPNVNPIIGTTTVTVNAAQPVFGTVTAADIAYGDTLSKSVISGTATIGPTSIAGTFSWKDPTTKVQDIGYRGYAAVFTPTDPNYRTATGQVGVKVNKANVTLTNVTASAINSGQALSESTLSGTAKSGDTPVAGSIQWTDSSIKPTNGQICEYTFTPGADMAGNYNSATGKIAVTVNNGEKTVPTLTNVSATALTFGDTLVKSTLSGTATVDSKNIEGTWTWADPTIAPHVADSGKTTYNFYFTPKEAQYATASGSVTLVVNKATPVIGDGLSSASADEITTAADLKDPTATDITYGQTLASSTITGSASTDGSFAWTDPTIKPAGVGTFTYEYTFTPVDLEDWNIVKGNTAVKVNPATPVITSVSASNITLGETLASSTLTGTAGAGVEGKFSWTTPTTKPEKVGTANYDYTFTPIGTGAANYSSTTGKVSVTVDKAALTVSGLKATGITYGQSLESSKLTGSVTDSSGKTVEGTFEWLESSTILDAGTQSWLYAFMPTDTENYNSYVSIAPVTITPAAPTIIKVNAASITYGQTLKDSTLTGTAVVGDRPVEGTWKWDSETTMPQVADSGTTSYAYTFTPTGDKAGNYTTATGKTTVNVAKAQPTLTKSEDIMELSYGQTLSTIDLSNYYTATIMVGGQAQPVAGTWSWQDGSIQPTRADSYETRYTLNFTPSDQTSVSKASVGGLVRVNSTTPKLEAATSPITYGDTLQDSNLKVVAKNPYNQELVSGQWFWDEPNTMPAVSDSKTTLYTYEFCPDNADNYNWVSGDEIYTTVTVIKATPELADVTASTLTRGQKLSSSEISGTSNTNGEGVWNTPDTVPPEGTHEYTFTFKPTDTANWNDLPNQSVSVTVSKAVPVVAYVNASDITYGQTLKDSTITGTATVNGDSVEGSWSWTDTTIMPNVQDSGQTAYSYTFTPSDPKFDSVTGTVTLTVNKAEPTLSGITATGVDYGQTLADSTVNGKASATVNGKTIDVPGTWSWQDAATAPEIGTHSYTCVFTPTETLNYKAVTGQANVTVGKVTPAVSGVSASDILQGQVLENSTITGVAKVGDNEIKGTWSFKNPEQEVDQPGTQTYDYIFTPEDQSKYNVAEGNVSVTVKAPYLSISCANIKYGDQLAPQFVTNTSGGTVSYQYSSDGGSTWTDAMPTELGTYQVRGTAAAVGQVPSVTSAAVTFTIAMADAVILNAPSATDITTKQALSDSYLAGSASVPGTFTWYAPDTVPGKVGDYQYDVTFTPTDTTHYKRFTTSATVSVKEEVAIVVQSKVYDGEKVTVKTEKPGAAITQFYKQNETTRQWDAIGTVEPVNAGYYKAVISLNVSGQSLGTQSADAALSAEAADQTDTTYFRIFKKVPTIDPAPTASNLQYGQKLSESTLSGGQTDAIEGGTFAWNDDKIVPEIGTASYLVVFTPVQTNNYYEVAGYVDVKTAQTYAITVTSGTGGTITPAGTNGTVYVENGADQTFTVKADRGYVLKDVKVDDSEVTLTDGAFTFSKVAGDHAITAEFTPLASYTISAGAGAGGSISDPGDTTVYQGEDRTYTVTPDDGYEIADVTVDGTSVGAVSSYTFKNIRAGHTISASFKAKAAPSPTPAPTASGGTSTGSASASGSSSANTGITTQSPFAAAAAGLGLLAAAVVIGTVIWRRKKD